MNTDKKSYSSYIVVLIKLNHVETWITVNDYREKSQYQGVDLDVLENEDEHEDEDISVTSVKRFFLQFIS